MTVPEAYPDGADVKVEMLAALCAFLQSKLTATSVGAEQRDQPTA